MLRPAFLSIASLIITVSSVLAQQPDQPKAAAVTTSPNPSGMPTNPDLTVATVKLQGGSRVSKLIGSAVYNDHNEKIGSLDDLIMKDGNRIVMGVVSVGGSLGMRNKLVAVPYDHLEADKDQTKITMPGAVGDIYRAVVSVGPDGTLIRETYRVRDGGVDKVDEIELHVPGNGAGNVDKDGG